jgi:hypothetical protein
MKPIKEVKTYKLPFKLGKLKEFKEHPKIVDGKKLTYAGLELGIGSAMEIQKIKMKVRR